MSDLLLLAEAAAAGNSPPSLGLFLVAAVSGLLVLLLTMWLGRSVESGAGRLALFLLGLAMSTALVLLVLSLFGGMSVEAIG